MTSSNSDFKLNSNKPLNDKRGRDIHISNKPRGSDNETQVIPKVLNMWSHSGLQRCWYGVNETKDKGTEYPQTHLFVSGMNQVPNNGGAHLDWCQKPAAVATKVSSNKVVNSDIRFLSGSEL